MRSAIQELEVGNELSLPWYAPIGSFTEVPSPKSTNLFRCTDL